AIVPVSACAHAVTGRNRRAETQSRPNTTKRRATFGTLIAPLPSRVGRCAFSIYRQGGRVKDKLSQRITNSPLRTEKSNSWISGGATGGCQPSRAAGAAAARSSDFAALRRIPAATPAPAGTRRRLRPA